MLNLKEYRTIEEGLADPTGIYDSIIENGVMLNKDGSFMASWYFRGPDLH